jgi:glycosyltransferase involved in cell wall biosynthesis
VSELAASHVEAALGVHVAVTPNGIDPEAWRVPSRTAYTGVLRVTSVMRMAPRKRTEPLVRMLASAIARQEGALTATLVGDGPDRTRAERLARRLGVEESIKFTGRLDRSRILAVFGDSDVYIQPSVKESFGFAALEARTAGLPVVARSQAGTSQFIHEGVEGLLASDDEGMIDALVRLAREPDLRERLAQHNRSTLPLETWPSVLAAVERAYTEAMRSSV